MATKTIAWTTGSGNITLTYTGQGNGSISVTSSANEDFDDRSQSISIVTTAGSPEQALSVLITQKGKTYDVGTKFNFGYTGATQKVTLPKGKYKLQCWGAQGAASYSNSAAGGKGGYSEGVITLTQTTTFEIQVGGQGGYNGGGSANKSTYYDSGGTYGQTYMGNGGGATDIRLEGGGLLSRFIVAGGGSGGAYVYRKTITTSSSTVTDASTSSYTRADDTWVWLLRDIPVTPGKTYNISTSGDIPNTSSNYWNVGFYSSAGAELGKATSHAGSVTSATCPSGCYYMYVYYKYGRWTDEYMGRYLVNGFSMTVTHTETTSSTSERSDKRDGYVGGGTSGAGYSSTYQGKQNAAGSGGSFGQGANQTVSNYRYASAAGGGGWYGGGGGQYSDSSMDVVHYSGGGSGFVNTAANASYRPSGYTGLQLDSGSTKAGNTSFESTSGGSETGHSGNGYARITVIE